MIAKSLVFARAVFAGAAVAAVLTTVWTVAVEPTPDAARLISYSHPKDGANYFALSLKPPVAASSGPRDVVMLVSTAASQTGEYRTKSLEAVRDALAGLGPSDRVRLMAFDIGTVPLTKDFAAPNSPEVAQALEKLNQRTPLGACDLGKALGDAAASYRGGNNPRALVYIGDGSSRANGLSPKRSRS